MNRGQRGLAVAVFTVTLAMAFLPSELWSRLMPPPGAVDEQWLAEQSDVIFRGRVTQVKVDPDPAYVHELGTEDGKPVNFNFIALFRVDRVYRGKLPREPVLHFEIEYALANGHDCISFKSGQYWAVFADIKNGKMIPADDCVGALEVSPLLGSKLKQADWSRQMEADFIAGLADRDPAARIVSLQRLGGLKLASSRPAIHREIEQSAGEERKWAVYAALRTSDFTVLPLVKDYLAATGDRAGPEDAMISEFRHIKDPAAVPGLLNILASAADDETKEQVLVPLVDNIGDPRAIRALGESLSSSSPQILYLAVTGLGKIAHADACKISGAGDDEKLFRQQVAACKAWWDGTGSHENWGRN
jgi:hypothetical protein